MYKITRFDIYGKETDVFCVTSFEKVKSALGGLPISGKDENGNRWCFDGANHYKIAKDGN